MSEVEGQNPEAPKIEFPCANYPIKVMGDAGEVLKQHVIAVFSRHADDFDAQALNIRPSRNGRFESLTVSITATSEAQLVAIFEDLKTNSAVKMVL